MSKSSDSFDFIAETENVSIRSWSYKMSDAIISAVVDGTSNTIGLKSTDLSNPCTLTDPVIGPVIGDVDLMI